MKKNKIIAILGGGDWNDASVNHLVLLSRVDLKKDWQEKLLKMRLWKYLMMSYKHMNSKQQLRGAIQKIVLDCFLTGEAERDNPRGAEYGNPNYWTDQLVALVEQREAALLEDAFNQLPRSIDGQWHLRIKPIAGDKWDADAGAGHWVAGDGKWEINYVGKKGKDMTFRYSKMMTGIQGKTLQETINKTVAYLESIGKLEQRKALAKLQEGEK